MVLDIEYQDEKAFHELYLVSGMKIIKMEMDSEFQNSNLKFQNSNLKVPISFADTPRPPRFISRAGIIYAESCIERFWEKVDIKGPDDCWLWESAPSTSGYGVFYAGTRTAGGWPQQVKAHRFSYVCIVGDIPEGMWVLHRCDTPLCVNPFHLFLGTALDNTRDMISKGRAAWQMKEAC
jgi:hypothetical protein